MEQRDLSRLVRDSQAGDPQAQERLVLAVQNYVCFYCRTMLDNEDAAMDAAQDVLLAMLSGLPSLREPDAFRGWLRQIVIRTCGKRASQLRRERLRRQELSALSPEDEGRLSQQLEPDELLDREEVRRAIMELVNALPESQRLCVLLYYYDELSVEEIAAALKVPAGTVKSRLYYARTAIRQGAEKYAGQGFPLYGLSPLPFLSYFLRQEAGCGLAAAGLAQAAGAGTAAGGTAAIAAIAKSALELLAGRKALSLAALALAVAVSGGVLRQTAQAPFHPPIQVSQPAQPAPPEAPAPSPRGPEAPALPEPPPEEAAPAAEPAARPVPQSTKIAPPAQPEQETPPPTEEPEPQLPPEEPDGPEPAPDPAGPGPAPEEPDIPQEEPEPAVYVRQRPFVDHLGNGGYGYTTTFAQAWGEYLPPVEMTYSSSDPSVVAVNGKGEFTTLAPGTAVVSAVQETAFDYLIQYDLTVTVADQFRWTFDLPDLALTEGSAQVCTFDAYVLSMLAGYGVRLERVDWTASDGGVAAVQSAENPASCLVRAISPGEAEISGTAVFRLNTADGKETAMADDVSFRVTVEAAPAPDEPAEEDPAVRRRVLTEFGCCSGYGFTNSFRTMWRDGLPETLTGYASSDPAVVHITEEGDFTTLSAGTAELTAFDPGDPERPYVLTVCVQDRLDWTRVLKDTTVWPEGSTCVMVTGYSQQLAQKPISSLWESSDPSVADAVPDAAWNYGRVYGVALGEADVTVTFLVEVQTVVGTLTMEDTASFHVTVVP